MKPKLPEIRLVPAAGLDLCVTQPAAGVISVAFGAKLQSAFSLPCYSLLCSVSLVATGVITLLRVRSCLASLEISVSQQVPVNEGQVLKQGTFSFYLN